MNFLHASTASIKEEQDVEALRTSFVGRSTSISPSNITPQREPHFRIGLTKNLIFETFNFFFSLSLSLSLYCTLRRLTSSDPIDDPPRLQHGAGAGSRPNLQGMPCFRLLRCPVDFHGKKRILVVWVESYRGTLTHKKEAGHHLATENRTLFPT